MSEPFFRVPEVHAEALLLVGYRLYPCTTLKLHPRLTLLSGGNGAGKTTLLDALQTILIADRRYLHLNVAAGQNDRDLGGQLQGRVAWAVLRLCGHPEIQGIGVHLSRRAAAQIVDIQPFALVGIAPETDHFADLVSSDITQGLRELQARVQENGTGGRVKEFASLGDYHRFLFDEGLLPLDLSRGGRRQFSMLWRQATQPHMGELNQFLQQTLCHEPERKLTFEDVETLMRERQHAERQLKRLGELRQLDGELRSVARDLDEHRRQCLGLNLGQIKHREETVVYDVKEVERRIEETERQMEALREELEKARANHSRIEAERDKYVREQGEWSRRLKHHQEYATQKRLLESLQGRMDEAERELCTPTADIESLRERIEKTREDLQVVSTTLARYREKESELNRQARKWREFKLDLDRASQLIGKSIANQADLLDAWNDIQAKQRSLQELKPLRQLLSQWEMRAKAYRQARELAERAVYLWPDMFNQEIDRELLDEAQSRLREREKAITLRREALHRERHELKASCDALSRGRSPLPSNAAKLVDQGMASSFIERFDHLSLEEARDCQERIGPFARAIEPEEASRIDAAISGGLEAEGIGLEGGERLREFAHGKEPYWLVFDPEVWKGFRVLERSEEGTLVEFGGIGWYTPHEPVWIGAEAKREQVGRAQEQMLRIEAELKELTLEEEKIAARRKSIQDLLPKLDSLADTEAPVQAAELSQTVKELEKSSQGIQKLYAALQGLFQRMELFQLDGAPEKSRELAEEIAKTEAHHRDLERAVKELKAEVARHEGEQRKRQVRIQEIQREMERARTICARLEEEEPIEVLQGRVDFGKSEELAKRIRSLDEEKERAHQSLLGGERKMGELTNRYRSQGQALARAKSDLKRIGEDLARAEKWWNEHYPDKPPLYLTPGRGGEREHHKAVWENLVVSLRARLDEVSRRYDLKISSDEQPDALVPQLLQWLLPPGVELNQLEAQYTRLQHELQQIEQKIRGHVESIRSAVESEIRHLRMHLVRVNHILSSLHFGQIEKISLEIDELPAYKALGKLESVLRLLQRKEVVTLKEFIEQLRAFLLKEANVQLSEEQIADYRSYVRIRRVIVDKEGRVRETGLSSGETLGVNLALCLAILFFLGRERGGNREHAMLLLALDEAERLDARALESIRELLNSVRCQLTVAMPRPVEIPDSVCHLLTPLPQGVTHIRLYRQNGNGGKNGD